MPSLTPASQTDLPGSMVGIWAVWQGPAGVTAVWASLPCLLCPLVQRWLLVSAGSSFLLVCVLDPAAHSLSLIANKAAR